MPPFNDQFKIGQFRICPHDTDRIAGAVNFAIGKSPCIFVTVDIHKIVFAERSPAGTSAVDAGSRCRRRCLRIILSVADQSQQTNGQCDEGGDSK